MAPISAGGGREKQSAALTSLLAAVGLTALKIAVAVASGSLGILAEVAHSGLDLVGTLMTYLAVRVSGRPPDRTHPYGHGKIESLSALAECLVLLATCAWVVREAVLRLVTRSVEIEVTWWAFAVMLVSIAVEASRAHALKRVAKKFTSPALEADALHFQSHIWSTAVVILGLTAVKIGQWWPSLAFLRNGDPLAALGVSGLVAWVTVRLGRSTVDALLDSAPAGMEDRIAAIVAALPGIHNCHNIRIRYSGPVLFIDLHVLVDGRQTLAEAHSLTETIETAIQGIAPGADVTVHPEPF